MEKALCQLCRQQDWLTFSTISFGLWDKQSMQLSRQSSDYPLGRCQNCGHVQVNVVYTPELFEQLYFHSTQEAVMWHESLLGSELPYEEMMNFALNGEQPQTIVDFGCGEGKLLAAAKAKSPGSCLIGIDFNNRFTQEDVTYLTLDLNQLSSLSNDHWPEGIDLALASHVLEHLIDPVSFLSHLKSRLSDNGAIFIEVPDFTHHHDEKSIGMSNLVNLQHIHYYTIDTLTFAAKQASLAVVKQAQVTTGYIPRLQVLLKPERVLSTAQVNSTYDAAAVIRHYQSGCRSLRSQLAQRVCSSLKENNRVGLWGLGADFYNLLNEHPLLGEFITNGKLVLFDYALKGKAFQHQSILCSDEIPHFPHPVFIVPQLAETRIKMRAISRYWSNVIDPFYNGSN
ncbi:class I SAM-dependent methyltransferase [Shewanella sp. BJSY2023SW005]|uniref:class I SAM-dependent methyltransferase n=1 Tax=Shewanella sp. BJSY2023SW005 TaxID=3392043 RepID=UPI0039B593A9